MSGFSGFVTFIFFITMLFYAGFRSHRFITQVPANFRTTKSPKTIPLALLDDFLPPQLAKAPPAIVESFEFPAVTVCPADPSATVSIVSCVLSVLLSQYNCSDNGYVKRSIDILAFGRVVSCITVNDAPSAVVNVTSADDTLEIVASLSGVPTNSANGVVVITHAQLPSVSSIPKLTPENVFATSAGAIAEIYLSKTWYMPLQGNGIVEYDLKASSVAMNASSMSSTSTTTTTSNTSNSTNSTTTTITSTGSSSNLVKLDMRYPELVITYEVDYLTFDSVKQFKRLAFVFQHNLNLFFLLFRITFWVRWVV